MAYNKYKFYDYNSPYKDSKGINDARNSLLAIQSQSPAYNDSFRNQIEGVYGRIKNRQDFSYNPQNDAAYRQYADQYRALVGLAVAGNQAQAQELTGGYGSTYAPEVARQGVARLNTGVEMAQPAFLQLAQNAYDVNGQNLYNAYSAAAGRRDAELEDFGRQADVYNDRYQRAADYYNMLEDRGYDRYMGNREFNYQQKQMNIAQDQANKELELQKYDTYYSLAGNKCGDYAAKGDNKGMKAYLDGLVKAGKLTPYMADNLYKANKYTPPKSSGGGGGRRSRSKKVYGDNPKTDDNPQGFSDYVNDWIYAHRDTKYPIKQDMLSDLNVAYERGEMTEDDLQALIAYYGLEKTKLPTAKGGGNSGLHMRYQQTR